MLTLYFSGTGNSKYVAQLLAAQMGGACHSIEETVDFNGLLSEADTVAFVYPVYVSRVPRIMREFAAAHQTELHGKRLVILCTQMEFSGDGAHSFVNLLPRKSVEVVYAEHILMPNNINNLFLMRKTTDEKAQVLFAKARETIERICADINAGVVKKRGFNLGSRLMGSMQGVFQPLFERLTRSKIKISADCIGCGLCVKRCPTGNLSLIDGKAQAGNSCTQCYRCLNLCPERAVNLYFKGKVSWQYRGPRERSKNASA